MSLEKGSLSIHSENIFPIIKKWLYSDHDIFVRELISNASDAITKLQKLVMINEAQIEENPDYKITVTLDEEAKTLTFSDNGIGMTAEEIKKYINQIAFSGAEDFIKNYKDKSDKDQIIGHFGLGFYSAFMVSSDVEIHTRSYLPDAEPVNWKCDGGTTFEMTEGTRESRGTDIILHITDDGKDFLKEYEVKQTIKKYCSFMPVEIFFDIVGKEPLKDADGNLLPPEPLNETKPLYTKQPSECTDEDYKSFYQSTFNDFKEPLFWIHLNMDYPFNLKGILYFPRLNTEFDRIEGQIKLYNSQVFVADNIKEVIPEFLLLLKGVIDCPDLPLNVSRSFLQNDGFVKKISSYITKKVADKLNALYKTERETYEGFWDDINPFIKFGALKDEKFYENVEKSFIYKTIEDTYVTLSEYLEKAPDKKVYYATDTVQQAQYISLFKSQEMNAVILDHPIDSAFISLIESKNEDVKFERVDADVSEALRNNSSLTEEEQKTLTEKLTDFFKKALDLEAITLRLENMKSENLSSMIVLSEESRRMQDMMKMYSMPGMNADMLKGETTLVLNEQHPLVDYLIKQDDGDNETVQMICAQLYDLALLSHTQLSPEAMTAFISRSNTLLTKLI
ncbi:molecular chaperone HtpG [Fusibacter paucivorans]|uniref:Molecular chaperone HtpG n=1 Tax=Fusibacter paucivorans TaxID=76009 RepID=A0ABS5PLU8_9FIRM|nr:molecular chaperone HtpG [Fusibacter paucivorans]MBS7526139.1 molecular chaperone HtpG [Fusibacter paucivorans]